MPYYFSFYNDNEERIFYEKLKTRQCIGHNVKGKRCKRKCTIGFEYCPLHLEANLKLKVKKSQIQNAGKGLYAYDKTKEDDEIVFKKNDKICTYNGEVIDNETRYRRYHDYTSPYGIMLNNNTIIDASILRGVGSLINHGNNRLTNVRFSVNHKDDIINLVAVKNIKNNEELIVNYGRDYDFEDNYKLRSYPTKN
jgi:hypothetical protein